VRENRTHGSEGGEFASLPLSKTLEIYNIKDYRMQIVKGFTIFILIVFLLIIIFTALIMPNYLDNHISQVVSLIGVLTALVSIIWTQYNKSIEERNKASQYESEKKHQITKEKYQELFTKKIEIYTSLHKELYAYEDNLLNVGREDIDVNEFGKIFSSTITNRDVFIKFFLSLDELFKNNLFVISNDLETKYKKIKKAYSKSENYIDEYFSIVGDVEDTEKEHSKEMDKFITEHRIGIEDLIRTIENEIKVMKSDIWNK